MNPDIHLVLQLQSLDNQIASFEKEIATLPRHIAEIEKTLDSHIRRLDADRAALTANQRDRNKLEGDIQVHEQKISKLRDQTLQAKNNEQYKAFQNEISFIQAEIRKAEDRILELMTESEPLEVNVKKAEAALKTEKAEVDSEKNAARERTAADQREVEQLHKEREEAVKQTPPALLKLYEKVRRKWHGRNPLAEVQDSRCMGCQISLRPQHFQDIRRGDTVLTCEACGRILYYNPPVDVEKEMADRQAG